MSCCHTSSTGKIAFLLLALCVPVVVGFLVRDGLRDFHGKDRIVSVRGLAEREVKADLAAWPFLLSATDNDLASAQVELERQEGALRQFLTAQGLDASKDLSVLRYDAQDLLAQQYRPEGVDKGRYVLTKTMLLRTGDVDKVAAAGQSLDALVKQNVALGAGSQPTFIFTGLNSVKPDMIKEATANAFEAAQQFAANSGAHVGAIASATQGVFSIDGRDEIQALGAEAQLNKKVRVVTSVTYRLD